MKELEMKSKIRDAIRKLKESEMEDKLNYCINELVVPENYVVMHYKN